MYITCVKATSISTKPHQDALLLWNIRRTPVSSPRHSIAVVRPSVPVIKYSTGGKRVEVPFGAKFLCFTGRYQQKIVFVVHDNISLVEE